MQKTYFNIILHIYEHNVHIFRICVGGCVLEKGVINGSYTYIDLLQVKPKTTALFLIFFLSCIVYFKLFKSKMILVHLV